MDQSGLLYHSLTLALQAIHLPLDLTETLLKFHLVLLGLELLEVGGQVTQLVQEVGQSVLGGIEWF